MKFISNSPLRSNQRFTKVVCLLTLILGIAVPLSSATADIVLPTPAQQPFTPPIKLQLPDGTNGYSLTPAANPVSMARATFVNVPAGYSITNGSFPAWCADAPTLIYPREYVPGLNTVYKPVFYNSNDTAALQAGGLPADPLVWSKINYIINHKSLWAALPANVSEIQCAIWRLTGFEPNEESMFLDGSIGYGFPSGTVANVLAILADADANGGSFVPGPGQLIAVVMAFPAALQTGMIPTSLEGLEGQLNFIEVEIPSPNPCVEMTKTANKTRVAPYEPVIYTYLVHNCGNTTLTNIVVTDDNGTPSVASDDFTVGSVPSLAPGASATLTATVIPVVSTIGVVNASTVPAGAVIVVTSLANGDIKVTYLQSFGINDNTYGTGAIGWPNGHKFRDLTGSDKLEFRFFSKDGSVAIDFYVDTITAASSVTVPGTGQVISYPSGYGTLGPFGGDGFMVAGNANNIVTFSTSISDNLNKAANLPNKAALIVNSPTSLVGGDVVVDPVKAPGGWNYINSFTAVVKASTFTAGGGFASVAVPDQHNSPNKLGGPNGMTTTVTDSRVTNTAIAKTGSLSVTATATVAIVANPASLSGYVYVDANNSGTKDAGETPIAGVTVTLSGTDTLGPVNNITTTDVSGYYSFTALLPGTYTLTETQPAAYIDGKDAIGSQGGTTGNDVLSNIVLAAGVNGVQNNFGEIVPVPPASVSGFVYFDPNNNGLKEAGEPPIAGATLTLTGTDDLGNPVSKTATTDGAGAYSFTNLRPGTYLVSETQPAPYLDGKDAVGTVGGSVNGTLVPPDAIGSIVLAAGASGINYNFGEIDSSVPVPGFTLAKTASTQSAQPYQPVTYSYTVTNTGGTTLTGIVVTDNNGTPGLPSDDFTVGTIPTLAPGDSATLTATVIPVVSMIGVVNGATVNAGAIIVVVPQANGDIKVSYLQDFGINDNTYGTGAIGWPSGHKFGDLTGSDKLEFRFFDKNGTVVLDFYVDCITADASVTVPGTGQVISYPSGYGTLGPFGGDGSMVAGSANNIVSFSTSISDNLNNPANLPKKAALIVDSPTSLVGGNVVIDPLKAPGGWNHINTYTVVVKASTFAAGGGFGSVAVPDQHNSPNKLGGPNGMTTTPTNSTVVNTAKASAEGLTATATASVAIVVLPPVASLASPWTTQDIGAVGAVGSASYSNGIFSVNGSGNDLGGKDGKDEFRYVDQSASDDCTMVAKVLTVQKTNNAATAGVMIRETLTDTSRFAGVFVTVANGIQFIYRTTTGGPTTSKSVAGLVAPYWVKVTRVGNTFTAFRSTDGNAWTQVDNPVTFSMAASVNIGLEVNSKADGTLCAATIGNVTATP